VPVVVEDKYVPPPINTDYPLLDDICGSTDLTTSITDVVFNIQHADLYGMMCSHPDKSYLFKGEPGTGKTFAMQVIRNELINSGLQVMEAAYDIGQYGTAYINMGAVNLQKYFDMLDKYAHQGNCVLSIFDECLTGDTLITMHNGTHKMMRNIKDGDKVAFGGEVSDKFHKSGQIIEIVTSNDSLKMTHTHPNLAIKKGYKLVELVRGIDLEVGDKLLVPKNIPHIQFFNWSKEQLAFVALILCDGHVSKDNNLIRVSISKKDYEWYKNIFTKGCESFGEFGYKITENARGDINLYVMSSYLKRILHSVFEIPLGKKSTTIIINEQIRHSSKDSIKSFIDVCLCCEGTLQKKTAINFSTTSKSFGVQLMGLMTLFGITGSMYKDVSKLKISDNCNMGYKIFIPNINFELSLERKRIQPKQNKRSSTIYNYAGIDCYGKTILEINNNHNMTQVHDFTTESSLFVANGILTHNCDSLLSKRGNRMSSHKEDDKLLNCLMKNQQRIHDTDLPIYLIFATNFPEALDDASIRSGRIDKIINFELPDEYGLEAGYRNKIATKNKEFKKLYREGLLIKHVQYPSLAKASEGFNYADIDAVIENSLKQRVKDIITGPQDKIVEFGYVNHKQLLYQIDKLQQDKQGTRYRMIGFNA